MYLSRIEKPKGSDVDRLGYLGISVAHWRLVPVDQGSNPGGEKKNSFFIIKL